MKRFCLFFMILGSLSGIAQDFDEKIKMEVRKAAENIKEFVAIPNDAKDHSSVMRNISWLTKQFTSRGFNTAVIPTEGEPLFFAVRPMVEELPTILFYMHFDGQPVDPTQWNQKNPYEVVLKKEENGKWIEEDWSKLNENIDFETRLFGRSVSDDKGPIVMLLSALDLLKQEKKKIPFNIKVILDGEEEKGSKPLPDAVKKNRELLAADFIIINDGPVHASEKATLVYGCRGITTIDITTFGPAKPQHSGHFGNYAPNPGFQMAQLLASMKDSDGRVIIEGYYDGITLDAQTKEVLNSVPDDELAIQKRLSFKTPEKVGANYQESLQYPSLNIRGLSSGWIGEQARTIVPDKATAAIDIRLVPESDGERLKGLLKKHIEKQGYYITSSEPSNEQRQKYDRIAYIKESPVTPPFRTAMNNKYAVWAENVLTELHGVSPVKIRIMGGTVPTAAFINTLNIPAVIIPMVNPDNNQHSPNENLKVKQIAYGIRTFYSLLSTQPPKF
ncbi:M20/M25/M40 family metallo-hydrolase [Ascidiimonas sp. W6]|uniref:M20/M25/M40 family metallo-hydrolase n=1 Tax=Ascidiimonas meishanensis TaxID=3128903 RepID=UPI0030EBF027